MMIVALACSIGANGQVNVGVKGGLNLFNVKSQQNDNSGSLPGVHLGFLTHIHITEQFALQPELFYSVQGGKTETDGATRKLNLGYLNMPLMFQYMFDNGFRLQAGPQLGILTSAKSKSNGNSTNVKGSFNSLEFGIPVGVGYVSPSGFGVDVRYHVGASNIREDDENKAYNRGVQIGLFYLLRHD